MSKKPVSKGTRVAGIILMVLGAAFILTQAGAIPWSQIWGTWWPVILVVLGAWRLIAVRPVPWVSGVFLVVLGLLCQLAELDVYGWGYVWAIFLLAVGAWLLLRPASLADEARGKTESGKGALDLWSVFGGTELHVTSPNFRGGQVTALFGGATVDLRGATPVSDDVPLTINAIFGGVEVVVPDGWRLVVQGAPIFGGIEDNRRAAEATDASAPVLRVAAFAFFGGVELKGA